MNTSTINENDLFSKKSLKWLKRSIDQNWKLIKAYDYNYISATQEELEDFIKNKLFELVLETKLMQKDLNMRLGRV